MKSKKSKAKKFKLKPAADTVEHDGDESDDESDDEAESSSEEEEEIELSEQDLRLLLKHKRLQQQQLKMVYEGYQLNFYLQSILLKRNSNPKQLDWVDKLACYLLFDIRQYPKVKNVTKHPFPDNQQVHSKRVFSCSMSWLGNELK